MIQVAYIFNTLRHGFFEGIGCVFRIPILEVDILVAIGALFANVVDFSLCRHFLQILEAAFHWDDPHSSGAAPSTPHNGAKGGGHALFCATAGPTQTLASTPYKVPRDGNSRAMQ